jgi:hypothetical protein
MNPLDAALLGIHLLILTGIGLVLRVMFTDI